MIPPQGVAIITKEDIRFAVWDSLEVTPPSGSYGERFISMLDVAISTRATPLTFERYADILLAAGASYTPTVSGFFHVSSISPISMVNIRAEYYSDEAAVWYVPRTKDYAENLTFGIFISDGVNFRVRNVETADRRTILMRTGYSKPNPSPKVGRQVLYGKPSIVLESDEKGFIWIEEEMLTKLCEDVFIEVKEAKEKGEPHPLIGKTLALAIKEDVEDKMGWGKYKPLLRELGYDV